MCSTCRLREQGVLNIITICTHIYTIQQELQNIIAQVLGKVKPFPASFVIMLCTYNIYLHKTMRSLAGMMVFQVVLFYIHVHPYLFSINEIKKISVYNCLPIHEFRGLHKLSIVTCICTCIRVFKVSTL